MFICFNLWLNLFCNVTDISGSAVNVDVGVCKLHCGHSASFDTSLRASRFSSMLDYLRNKKVTQLDLWPHEGDIFHLLK